MDKLKGREDFVIILVMLMLSIGSFFLGRLSSEESRIVKTPYLCAMDDDYIKKNPVILTSKNGTKYYYPWCTHNIKKENIKTFSSPEDAEDSGYSLAANCNLTTSE